MERNTSIISYVKAGIGVYIGWNLASAAHRAILRNRSDIYGKDTIHESQISNM